MTYKRRKKKTNVYEQVTERIIKALSNAQDSWVKTWKSAGGANLTLPYNIVSKNNYRGANLILTFCSGYSDPRWASYKQWKDNNCQVKKDEKGTKIIKFDTFVINKGTDDEEIKWYIKQFSVFNAEQVEGNVPSIIEPKEDQSFQLSDIVENYKKRENIRILFGGNKAFYSPSKDAIVIPSYDDFNSEASFYSTLFHEMAHSTGHKNRLNRPGIGEKFGSHEYSKEELIAEFTSAFIMAYTGREDDMSFENSVEYLRNWSTKLRENPNWAISAASKAQKAMDYILGIQ
tara:strand:- start:656 stop:1519 length:864 start_codon:yes stop_codon:yes gene_type:complete